MNDIDCLAPGGSESIPGFGCLLRCGRRFELAKPARLYSTNSVFSSLTVALTEASPLKINERPTKSAVDPSSPHNPESIPSGFGSIKVVNSTISSPTITAVRAAFALDFSQNSGRKITGAIAAVPLLVICSMFKNKPGF